MKRKLLSSIAIAGLTFIVLATNGCGGGNKIVDKAKDVANNKMETAVNILDQSKSNPKYAQFRALRLNCSYETACKIMLGKPTFSDGIGCMWASDGDMVLCSFEGDKLFSKIFETNKIVLKEPFSEEQYTKIQKGDSYETVKSKLNKQDGYMSAQFNLPIVGEVEQYTWRNPDGTVIEIQFSNGRASDIKIKGTRVSTSPRLSGQKNSTFGSAVDASSQTGVITGTEVRMRKYNNVNSEILGYFDKGERVAILDNVDGWFKVHRSNNTTGWVSGDFCKIQMADVNVVEEKPNGASSDVRDPARFGAMDKLFIGKWKQYNPNHPKDPSSITIKEADPQTGGYQIEIFFYRIADVKGFAAIDGNKLVFTEGKINDRFNIRGMIEKTNSGIRLSITESGFKYVKPGSVYEYNK